MAWIISRFRAGDLVEVRARKEIFATLDQHGCLDGMPFMPEMLQYCGEQFRVSAVAHKTCDTSHRTLRNRKVNATVHLTGIRCDGTAHGGCQAACTLFWKDDWLKPVAADGNSPKPAARLATKPFKLECSEYQLLSQCRLPPEPGDTEPRYSCQATQLFKASHPMAWWDPRQHILDVWTGNRSLGRVLRVLFLASVRWLTPRIRRPWRLSRWFQNWIHQTLTGRGSPSIQPRIPAGSPTPTGRLNLELGEYVRIKSKAEIEQTLDTNCKNRGLFFDKEEMAPYCGGVYKVRGHVERIIDESTGKMREMKQRCVMLENVVCRSEYATGRLNCPRAIYAYWREIWLERLDHPPTAESRQSKSTYGASDRDIGP